MTTLDTAFKKLMVKVIKEELEKMNLQSKAKRKYVKSGKYKKQSVPIEQKIVMTKETRREDKLGRVISPRKKTRSDFGKKRKGQALKNIRASNAKWQAKKKLDKKLAELSAS